MRPFDDGPTTIVSKKHIICEYNIYRFSLRYPTSKPLGWHAVIPTFPTFGIGKVAMDKAHNHRLL
jgi:hypothetical protein